ncbi:DUF1372 family protein [Streptococcus suis]
MRETVKFTASMIIVLLATLGFIYMIYQIGYQTAKNEQQPVIVYQADNAGGVMVGRITDKDIITSITSQVEIMKNWTNSSEEITIEGYMLNNERMGLK